MNVTRYACDLNTCTEDPGGFFVKVTDYWTLEQDCVKKYDELYAAYRMSQLRLANMIQSRDWFQRQADMKVFTGL